MKTNLLQTSFFQLATFLLFSLFLSNTGFSITYTSIADGSYNDCSIWDNGCPNNTIQVGDTVIINHVVNASSSMNVIGVLIVNVSGDFSTNNDMETQIGSTFIVDGSFGLTGELEVNGEMFNSGFSSIGEFCAQRGSAERLRDAAVFSQMTTASSEEGLAQNPASRGRKHKPP